MGIAKVSSLAVASLAKVNSLAKLSINKINSATASFAAAFTDSNAVSKGLATGTSHAVYMTDTADTFNFVEDEAFTISFWVKAGWSSSLNTNIHLIMGMEDGTPTYQQSSMIKIYYNESNNRLYANYANRDTSATTNIQKKVYWLFHANYGTYATAYAAAGLGATYWSASNRGNVGDNNFTMITLTKAATDDAGSLTMYWNASTLGTGTLDKNQSFAAGMSETTDRIWSLGSNGKYSSTDQIKTGNSTETVYNDLTIWNKELSAIEVGALYNSGTRLDAKSHSAKSNLIGYWKFESDGSATIESTPDFTIAGDSNITSV